MKKYIIYAPEYSKHSAGIKVLYKLHDELRKLGYEAFMYAPHESGDTRWSYIEPSQITSENKENDIIVYPEIVLGNPLQFQNVVRYVLYYPGKNGGEKQFAHYEKIFTYNKKFYDSDLLYINCIDYKTFCKKDVPKTTDCVFIYKGGKWKDIPELDNLPVITNKYPEKQEDLVALLQKTNILYSYDACSSLLDEAVSCGCEVKVITKDGYSDFVPEYTEVEAEEILKNNLKNFVKITQNMNYKSKIESISLKERVSIALYILRHLFAKYITHNFAEAKRTLNKSMYWRIKRAK